MTTNSPMPDLAQTIDALRRELSRTQTLGIDEDLRFRLGPVEIEFLLEISHEGGANTDVKFWVVNAGAKGTMSRGTTHRLTLTLHPYDARTRQDVDVASHEDQRPP